jgi:hypothetical protein
MRKSSSGGTPAFVALWIQSTGLGNEIWALDLALALRDPEGHDYSASSSLLDKELLYVDESTVPWTGSAIAQIVVTSA